MAKKKETKNINAVMEPVIPQEEQVNVVDVKGFIESKVIEQLGKPVGYSHTNAINVFENRWRVNVYTKDEGFVVKRKIANSFFCIWDGKNLVANPPIVK